MSPAVVRVSRPWTAAAGSVIGVLIAMCVCACSTPDHRQTVDDHPSKETINGSTVYRVGDQGHVDAAVLDTHDPRHLLVLYPEPLPPATNTGGQCPPLLRPFAYIKNETGKSVAIGIGGYRPQAPAPTTSGSSYYLCHTSLARYLQLPVRLASPLGSRKITSSASGGAATVITDRSVPTPSFIPAGYEPVGLTATLDLQAERRYRHGSYELDIVAGAPAFDRPVQQTSHTRIGTYPAQVFQTQQYRTVSWSPSSRRRIEVRTSVATDASVQAPPAPSPELSVDDLLRISRSIQP